MYLAPESKKKRQNWVSVLATELSPREGVIRRFRSAAIPSATCPALTCNRYNEGMENSEIKEAGHSEAETDEEFERRPTTLPNIGADLRGFSNREFGEKVGEGVLGCLYHFGKVLNLQSLVQIIVASDYEAALAGVDRGVETSRPLTPTENGIAVGIAMTPAVLREGEPRSVLVT
jgi:hypothetical protein